MPASLVPPGKGAIAVWGEGGWTYLMPGTNAHVLQANSAAPTGVEFAAASGGGPHVHPTSEVTGLDTALAAKAALSHSHTTGNVTGLDAALTAKQETSAKGQANGYASLGAGATVPVAQLGTGTASASTFLRGDQSWATPAGGGGGPVTVRLTADRATTLTAYQDATGLSFAVTAGQFYSFYFWVMFQTAATTTGLNLSLNAPANNFLVFNVDTPTSATARTLSNRRAVNTGATATAIDAANANTLAVIRGTINPTASGTLIVRFASEIAGSNVTVKAGSSGVLYTV